MLLHSETSIKYFNPHHVPGPWGFSCHSVLIGYSYKIVSYYLGQIGGWGSGILRSTRGERGNDRLQAAD